MAFFATYIAKTIASRSTHQPISQYLSYRNPERLLFKHKEVEGNFVKGWFGFNMISKRALSKEFGDSELILNLFLTPK